MLEHNFADRRTPSNREEQSRTAKKTFRNLYNVIELRQFAVLQNASSCNKRMHQNAELQNKAAAVLAPHGALRSGRAPCAFSRGTRRARTTLPVLANLKNLQTPKASAATASAADPAPKYRTLAPNAAQKT